MRKFNLFMLFMVFFAINGFSQTNIAPLATATAAGTGAAGCQTGPCSTLNDLNFGTCGTQQMWINTATPPSTTIGDDWIEWNFPSVRTFDSLIIHHGYNNRRTISGATVQYWDGTAWITHSSFTNLTQQCVNRIGIGKLSSDRFRITRFEMANAGQQSNPSFREIEIIEAPNGTDDAAVLALDSPRVFCSGSQNIIAQIANLGINQIDSVDVHWEIDGVAQPSIQYIGLLDTVNGSNPYTAQITLGSYSFPSGLTEIRVYTSNPNGVMDTTNQNDTLVVYIGPALNGVYTVNPSNPTSGFNFNSIADMNYALNTFGVCGPTTINVANGTYNEAIYLDNVPGLSATNHLIIDGGDSSQTILSQGTQFATLTFNGSPNVHVKNFTLEQVGASGDAVIFSNGSQYDTLSSCVTRVDVNSTSSGYYNISFSPSTTSNSSGVSADYNVVQNNRIIGGYYAIRIYGSTNDLNTYNQFINNEIDSAYYYGIYSYYQDSIEVVGNSINMLSRGNTNADGAFMYYSNNTKFSKNYIWSGDYGVYFYNYNTYSPINRKFEVSNNMVYSASDYGIYMYYVDSVNIWHNSVHVEGTSAPAIYIGASSTIPISNYDARNNIFTSSNTEALVTNEPDTIFTKLNNNDYFTATGLNLLNIDGVAYTNLAAYQTASPTFNTQSLEGNPQFVSSTNLHIVGTFVNDSGDATVGILEDIDGDIRPMVGASSVDIGADEYNPPTCPPPHSLMTYNPTTDSVTIAWNGNFSGTTFEYELVECGNAQGTGTVSAITSLDSLRIGNLNASTCYELYIREICGRGDSSMWVNAFPFFTLCEKDTLPFIDDFSGGVISPCWTISSTTDVTIESSCLGRSNVIDINYREEAITPPIKAAAAQSIEIGYYIGAGACINDPEDYEHFYVEYWDGTQWVLLRDYDGSMPNAFVWETFTLTQGTYDDSLMVRFNMIDGTTDAWQIDSVVVQEGPALDASIVEVVSPSGSLCPGSITPVLGVKNIGHTILDSVKVYWDINGVLDSLTYIGTINSGDTAAISLSTLNISASQLYDIMFYTAMPNGMADERPTNDTVKIFGVRTGLDGAYTLDPSQASSATNYTSFDALTQDLNAYGVCGPTTINVASGTYNEDIYLGAIPGASAVNPVLIDGGDSSQTIVAQGTQYATLTFDGAQHVKVANMTIEQTGFSGDAVIFSNGSRYDTVANCVTRVDVNSTSSGYYNISFSSSTTSNSTGVDANYNVVQNNRIIGGYYAIRIYGSTTNLNTYNQILNNEIDSAYYYGIYSYYQDSIEVVGNSINMLSRGNINADAAMMYYSNNTKFSKNYLWSGDYGVYFYNYNTYAPINRKFEVSNNMVYSENDYGIYMYYVDSVNIWHNSVHVEGTSPALVIGGTSTIPVGNYDVRNNILSSLNSEALEIYEPDTIFVKLNNNLYETAGPVLLNIDAVGYATLAGYQAARPLFNTLSLEGNPQFVSNTDLHILGSFVNDNGDGSVGIVEDIDGDVRPLPGASNVDIGADEFDPPSCPRPLSFTFYKSSVDSVTVAWDGNSSAGDYEIEVVDCGDPRGTGTASTISGDSVTLGGLIPNVCYEIYVREICARGDTSLWSDVFQFGVKDSCESFDNYSLGSVDAQSILIDGWDNNEGDAEVSNDYASSGSNSLKIHNTGLNGFSDVIANLDTYTSGKWSISMDFLIPRGNGGYYNILHNYLGGGGSVWAIETYLDSSGVATVNEGTNGAGVIGTYNFTPGAWNSISHIIDLDNDTAYLLINSAPTTVGWQFSLGAANGNQFNAFNFFSAANAGQTPLMYFDNFCIKAFEEASIDGSLIDLVAPIDNGLQCYSSTEAVSVELVNAGLDSLDFTVDTAEVTMVVSGATSQILSFTVNDNTLNGGLPIARGESINVPLGTIDMTAIGTYYFDAVVDIRADSVPLNDAYSDSITTQVVDGGMVSENDTICEGDTTTISVSGYYGDLQWQEYDGSNWVDIVGATNASVDVDPTIATEYRVLACGTDASDTVEVYVTNIQVSVINNPTIVACDSTGTDTLIATSTTSGIDFTWYDSPVNGNTLHTGDTLLFTGTPSGTSSAVDTFYVSGSTGGAGGSVGPVDNSIGASANYTAMNHYLLFTVHAPTVIESVDVIANGAGLVDVVIQDATTLAVLFTHTVSVPAGGLQTLVLNQPLPPGDYRMGGTTTNNAGGLQRNSSGASYPYISQDGSVEITGNTFSAAYYYFFYNWQLAGGCESPRQMVIGSVDCAVGLNNKTEVSGIIEVYPNPSNGLFTLNITTEQEENFVLSIRDVQGKLIYEENLSVKGAHRDEIDLEGLAKGVYYLQIQNDQATKVEKLIIQ